MSYTVLHGKGHDREVLEFDDLGFVEGRIGLLVFYGTRSASIESTTNDATHEHSLGMSCRRKAEGEHRTAHTARCAPTGRDGQCTR